MAIVDGDEKSYPMDDFSQLLKKVSGWLQRAYNNDAITTFGLSALLSLCLGLAAVAVDTYLPFTGVYTFLRTLMLIPLSASLFVCGYTVMLFVSYSKRREEGQEWVSLREQLSASWRRRIALVVFALGMVLTYASGRTWSYTLVSSSFVALCVGLLFFVRLTAREQSLDQLGLPDSRDVHYQQALEKKTRQRAAERERKQAMKKAQRRARLTGEDVNKLLQGDK